MQWIEISIVCERVATDEVTTLFGDYADNGIIDKKVAFKLGKRVYIGKNKEGN